MEQRARRGVRSRQISSRRARARQGGGEWVKAGGSYQILSPTGGGCPWHELSKGQLVLEMEPLMSFYLEAAPGGMRQLARSTG